MIRGPGPGAALLGLALAACGGGGGELREVTERRRAEGVVEEPREEARAPGEVPDRLPAFVLEGPGGDPTPPDTTGQPAPAPPPDASWTAGIVEASGTAGGVATLRDVRTGVNAGFDRVVLEFAGGELPAHRIEYVDRPVRECGSGRSVAVAGDGWLAITLRPARAHTDEGRSTVQRRNRRLDMPVARQLVFTCDFEAVVQIVLGVGSPNEFRVVELGDPARLIVDVRQ
jgi:hypothetical protein